MSGKDIQDSSSASDVQSICSVKVNAKSSYTAGKESSCPNSIKMKINPLDLLMCLRTLLNANGAIKSIDEVQRVAGLMGKYSKKLVSKCIYLNILQATEEALLDEFYKDTGWNLVCAWLTESVATRNFPLAQQILSLLLVSPISIDRLKRNNIPKMVKDLSKECPHKFAQKTADEVVQRWKELVKGCTIETVGSNSLIDANLVDDSNAPLETEATHSSLSSLRVNMPETTGTQEETYDSHKMSDKLSQNDTKVVSFTFTNKEIQLMNPSTVTPKNTIIEQKVKRGTKRGAPTKSSVRGVGRGGRGRKKRGVGRGRGKAALSYAELLCQDSESDDSTSEYAEKEKISNLANSHCSVPRLRIKIRNAGTKQMKIQRIKGASKVKAPAVEWTDSEDDRPLSEIRDVRQKGDSNCSKVPHEESCRDSSDDEVVRTKKKSKQNIIIEDDSDVDRTVDTKDFEIVRNEVGSGKHNDSKERDKKTDISNDKEKEKNFKTEPLDIIERKEAWEENMREKEDKLEEEACNMAENENHTNSKEANKRKDNDSATKGKEEVTTGIHENGQKRSRDDDDELKNKRKESTHGEERSHRKEREKKHRSSREREKEKEKKREKKSSKDKYKEKEKMNRRPSDDKCKERQREQEKKDKATLDKVKPLSTEGLARIPRKAPTFMDALGSADVTEQRGQNISIRHKSRISRSTGSVDESRTSHSSIKKHHTDAHSVKRLILPKEQAEGRKKEKESLLPAERLGGSKVTSPKKSHLSDDGGFMAALTAAGTERKKMSRKRKSSETDLRQEGTTLKSSKVEGFCGTVNEAINKDDLLLTSKNADEETEQNFSEKCSDDPNIPSATSVAPIPNFYEETLHVQDDASDGGTAHSSSGASDNVSNLKPNANDTSNKHSMEQNKPDDNMEIEELDDVKDHDVGDSVDGDDGDLLSLAPVPAPTNEEYEKIEVTFTAPLEQLKSALVYHRTPTMVKKGVTWRAESELKETFFFPMDETERVNVNTIKFNEMMLMEKAKEKELMFGKQRGIGRLASAVERRMPNNCVEFGPYKLYPVHLSNPPNVTPGYKSIEKHVQAQREHATMATFFHPALLPDTPTEPDPEMVQRAEPVIIPLNDVSTTDCVSDNRKIPWPEPIFTIPELPFVGGSSVAPPCPPQQSGGHWVLGNHSVSRFNCGSPMFSGPNGPPVPSGNHGGFGPPPQSYPGEIRGNWGGPGDFGGPPVIMANGPPHMQMHNMVRPNPGMQGGPPIQGGPGPGPVGQRPNMGIVSGPPIANRDSYQPRYRRGHGGGGSWGGSQGPRGYCKHFRNGHCRHGDECLFLHVPS